MCSYIRDGIFPIQEVISNIIFSLDKKANCDRIYNGHSVRMNSLRYQVFALKGTTCVHCGVSGEYFALEKDVTHNTNRFHFNLYATINGEEVMITKDHIIPKAKGGSDCLDNLQPMCIHCNESKRDKC